LNISPAQFVMVIVIVFPFVMLSPVVVPSTAGLFPRIAIAFSAGVLWLSFCFLFSNPFTRWLWACVVFLVVLVALFSTKWFLIGGVLVLPLVLSDPIELIGSSETRAWFRRVNALHREAKRYTRYNAHEALTKYEQLLEAYTESSIKGLFGSTAFFYRNVLSTLLWIADRDSQRALDCIFYLTAVVEQRVRRSAEGALENALISWTPYLIQDAVLETLVRILRDTDASPYHAFLSLAEAVSTATPIYQFCQKAERTGTLQSKDVLLAIYEAYMPLFRVVGWEEVGTKKTQWRKATEFLRLVPKPEQEEQQKDAWEEALEKLTALQQMECGREVAALYSIVACLARLQSPLAPEEISKCMDKLDVLRGEERLPLKNKVQVLEQLEQVAEGWTRCEQIGSSVGRRSCYADVREELDKIRPLVLTGPSGVLLGRIVEQWRDEIDQRITMPSVVPDRGVNPYIAGDVIREPDMFFGREEALAKVLDTVHGNHIAIYGERRIGKTSLLHQLDSRLRQVEDPQYLFIPAFVNLQGVPAERLFYTMMSAIAKSCQPRVGPLNLIHAIKREGYDAYDLVDDLETVLEALEATTNKQIRLVLLLDEGDELSRYDPEVQAQLRHILMTEAGHLKMVWSGRSIDKEWKLSGSPWYNLFAIGVRLTPFTREEALRLIQEPVKGIYRYDKDAIELILQYSEYKPFRIQQICLATINRVLAQKRRRVTGPIRVTKEDVERAYRSLTAEEAISREMEERGKVGLLEKQVAEGGVEYQVNTGGRGDQ
jgi:hypothetical protein